MPINLSPRRQLARLVRKHKVEVKNTDIEFGDKWIDEALTVIETEEPSMLDWLSKDPELQTAFRSTLYGIYASIKRDVTRGASIQDTIKWIDFLNYRLTCAVAWYASQRERESILGVSEDDGQSRDL